MTTLSNLGIKRSATEPTPVAAKIAAATTLDTKKQVEKTPQDQETSPKSVSFDLPPPPKMEQSRSRSRSYSRPSPGSVHTRSPSPIRRDRMSSRGRPVTRRSSTHDSYSRPSSRSSSRSQTRSPSRRRYRHHHHQTDQRYPEYQKHTEYQKYPEYPRHTEHQRHTEYDKHTEYQKRPEYTRHSEYTKHPEYTKHQKYQKHHGLIKKSAGFIAGIGLATVLARKVWPKGVPYGGEDEWERSTPRSSKHHHHHHHSHSHSSSGDRHHEHHHHRRRSTSDNPAERTPDHTRSNNTHGRDAVHTEEPGPYSRGEARRKSLDPRAFENLERGEPRRGRPTFREERPRSTVLPYPETPYPDENYYAPARARASTPAPIPSAR